MCVSELRALDLERITALNYFVFPLRWHICVTIMSPTPPAVKSISRARLGCCVDTKSASGHGRSVGVLDTMPVLDMLGSMVRASA